MSATLFLLLSLLSTSWSNQIRVARLAPRTPPTVLSIGEAVDWQGLAFNGTHESVPHQCNSNHLRFDHTSKLVVGLQGSLVLVVRSFWGDGFFHGVINEAQRFFLTCLAPSEREARSDVVARFCADALIYTSPAPRLHEWMAALGVAPSRLITQLPTMVRGVVLASGAPCGSFISGAVARSFALVVRQHFAGPVSSQDVRHRKLLEQQQQRLSSTMRAADSVVSPAAAAAAAAVAATAAATAPTVLLWMSRPDGTQRSLVNVAETHAYLREAWAKWGQRSELEIRVHLPSHTLNETFEMMRDAKVVAGPHGAGFANLLLASNRPSVIEFHEYVYRGNPPLVTHICFALLARQLNLPYVQSASAEGQFRVSRSQAHAGTNLKYCESC